jgi:hypothetical protein
MNLKINKTIYSNVFSPEEIENSYKIGVVGWSSIGFDINYATKILNEFYTEVRKKHNGTISIVSGWSNIGIPQIATNLAQKFGFIRIGYSAAEVLKYELCDVDIGYIVGEKFGDESEAFVDYVDEILKLGGGLQAERELKYAIKNKKNVIEYELPI